MTVLAGGERSGAPVNRPSAFRWPADFEDVASRLERNREKNLVNCLREHMCALYRAIIKVFEVVFGGQSEGLRSLVRLATFNRDKNLVNQISAGLWWQRGCLGQIVTNISQTVRLGLLRQGWVVKEHTHSYALGPHHGRTSRRSRGDKVSFDMRGFFCRQVFPKSLKVVYAGFSSAHCLQSAHGNCVSAEHTYKMCGLR